jgi:hypothetical protein
MKTLIYKEGNVKSLINLIFRKNLIIKTQLKNFSKNIKHLETVDEISELNKLLKKSFPQIKNSKERVNSHAEGKIFSGYSKDKQQDKVSFELDVYKDLQQFYESKENKEESPEEQPKETKLKAAIKKISQSELVTIQKDENIDKYKIIPQSDLATEDILNSIFKKGTNSNFVKNIDKIYEQMEMEEINLWEKIGTAKNIYNVDMTEKDLSEIEEEIEENKNEGDLRKKGFLNPSYNNSDEEGRDFDSSNSILNINEETNDDSHNEIQNLIKNLNLVKEKREASRILIKKTPFRFDYKTYFENFKKSLSHINEIHSSFLKNIPLYQGKTSLQNEKINSAMVIKQSESKTVSPKKSITNYTSKEFIESLVVSDLKETIVLPSINLTNSSIDNTFLHLKPQLFDEILIKYDKSKKEMKRLNPKKNFSQFLLDNYHIKSSPSSIFIKILKQTIITFDKKSINCITAKIKQLNPDVISIVYNTKRIANTKQNFAVFVIFADEVNLGNFILNCGVMNSAQSVDLFVSFISMILIENIQLACNEKILHFNYIFAKKFNLEFKLSSSNNKNIMNYVLSNLMDAKFHKLQKTLSPAQDDEIFKEDGTLKKNKNYQIPNLKFFSMPKFFTKYFKLFFYIAAQLEPGQICYKI